MVSPETSDKNSKGKEKGAEAEELVARIKNGNIPTTTELVIGLWAGDKLQEEEWKEQREQHAGRFQQIESFTAREPSGTTPEPSTGQSAERFLSTDSPHGCRARRSKTDHPPAVCLQAERPYVLLRAATQRLAKLLLVSTFQENSQSRFNVWVMKSITSLNKQSTQREWKVIWQADLYCKTHRLLITSWI